MRNVVWGGGALFSEKYNLKQASSEHSISVAIDAAGAAAAKKVTSEAFAIEIGLGTVAIDVIRYLECCSDVVCLH